MELQSENSELNKGKILNIFDQFGRMMKFLRMMIADKNTQKKCFQNLLEVDKNYSWKIYDIDDYLRGNPHII